ncbi:MAG: patatin-like phospholipase family protein [Thermodesulfobacteriota bacterium]
MTENRRMNGDRLFATLVIFLILIGASCAPPSKEIQTTPRMEPPRPTKIALVLGAGASKGFAHVGVIKILEANKIPIHMIVGTSVGSVVGSFYAFGYDAFQLQKLSFAIERGEIIDLVLPENGFIKGEKLQEFVNKTVKNTPIEKLAIPFYAVAADIQTGQEVPFGKGNTGMAVRASCSIPGIFRPVKIGERVYVDGGVVSPVAVDVAKQFGADVVIAVDITAGADRTLPENTIETILHSFNIMYSRLAAVQLSKADVIIKPKVGHIGSADFSKRHEAILEGERAAIEALPQIQQIVNQLRLEGRLE